MRRITPNNMLRSHRVWAMLALAAAVLLGGCRSGPRGGRGHEGLVYWPAANAQEIELLMAERGK